ncbi:MAG: hypothetical protein U1E05_08535 [Patescibacteria group bacterium]|nr:hypothetical protein [Patescibacteria group bacterium]
MSRCVFGGGLGPMMLLAAAAAVACGCSRSDGPTRYPVSGAVTHGGQPIAGGQVEFEPDGSKGNRGPAAYATIRQGKFATDKGEGTVGGPHVVRILATDGKANPESPDGNMVFSPFETTADLPKSAVVQDFDVPASHR